MRPHIGRLVQLLAAGGLLGTGVVIIVEGSWLNGVAVVFAAILAIGVWLSYDS